MDDIEFIKLGIEVLEEMQYVDISTSEYNSLIEKMRKIKLHIYNNLNNKLVQNFIEEFLNRYINLFFNKGLVDAFQLSKPFYKQIEIYKNLPSTTHKLYSIYLFYILELSSFPHFYPAFFECLEKYKPELINHPHLQELLTFVEQNKNIMQGSKDDYYSLEEEKRLYRKAWNGECFEELEAFAFLNKIMGQNEARNPFMNKRIGNIGEIYIYEFIKAKNNSCFVSKELKNGFGYDLYFLDDNSIENLIEVKSTISDTEEDFFRMSENEYNIMQQCENNPYAKYIVCRVKLDYALNLSSYTLLMMIDDTTLVDIFDNNIQYRKELIGENIHFKKVTQKIKLFEQPKK